MKNDCYVGITECGCPVFAAVDERERRKEVAKDIAYAISHGLRIERRSTQWVRENLRRCVHKKKDGGQGDLL